VSSFWCPGHRFTCYKILWFSVCI